VFDKELSQSIGLWIGRVKSPADIERESRRVNSALINADEKACPLRKVRGRHSVPWWNNELKKLKIKANRAFRIAYKSGSEEDWNKHREARRAFKKLVRRCKRECWQNSCYNVEVLMSPLDLTEYWATQLPVNSVCYVCPMVNGPNRRRRLFRTSFRRIFLGVWWSVKTPAPWIAYLSV